MKYLIVLVLVCAPLFAKAAVPDGTYFFLDNKGYNVAGEQTFFCFQDGSCYTVEGVFTFTRQLQEKIDQLTQKLETLQNIASSTPVSSPVQAPTPVSSPAPVPTPAPVPVLHLAYTASGTIVTADKLSYIKAFKYSLNNAEVKVNGQDIRITDQEGEYTLQNPLPVLSGTELTYSSPSFQITEITYQIKGESETRILK